ncbi:hypothetical protein [Sansalvadorimonas verongulae]|uniref:hypothetical protein n=1 Tax=Sansalvadorimonas verongulae TaxID=2172824 RepID=UPI001E5BE2CB|nr:hypothetical protein [Sansalvadorimonas verongulae]
MDDHSLPSLPTSSPREELLYLFSLGVIRHQRRTTENNRPDTSLTDQVEIYEIQFLSADIKVWNSQTVPTQAGWRALYR